MWWRGTAGRVMHKCMDAWRSPWREHSRVGDARVHACAAASATGQPERLQQRQSIMPAMQPPADAPHALHPLPTSKLSLVVGLPAASHTRTRSCGSVALVPHSSVAGPSTASCAGGPARSSTCDGQAGRVRNTAQRVIIYRIEACMGWTAGQQRLLHSRHGETCTRPAPDLHPRRTLRVSSASTGAPPSPAASRTVMLTGLQGGTGRGRALKAAGREAQQEQENM